MLRLSLALLCVSGARLAAQSVDPQLGLINRDASAYSEKLGKLYIVDPVRDSVAMIPRSGSPQTIKVGTRPDAIAVNNLTQMVYVVNPGSKSVSVIDGAKDEVVATIDTGARSYALAVDESVNKVYVANTFSTMLTVIDGATNTASNIKTGSADAVLVDQDRKRVYVLTYESETFTELDPVSGAISKVPAGALHLWGHARQGKKLYIAHIQDSDIAAIDLETHAVRNIHTGAMPCALALDADSGQIYVANYADGTVTVLKNELPVATIKVAAHPQALTLDAAKGLLYVASPQENLVTVIEMRSRKVVRRVKVPVQPYAVAVHPITHIAYAVSQGNVPFTKIEP
ncbi:MAG: YncE family protein [Acidobacteria bacterium]|nr:YncE family protein [Acidobacteriota bacterium]